MSWKRLATLIGGGALVAVGTILVQPVMVKIGIGMLGVAVPWPGDTARIKELEAIAPPARKV